MRDDPHLVAYEEDTGFVMAEHLLAVIFEERLKYHGHTPDEITSVIRQLMSGARAMVPLSVQRKELMYTWHLCVSVTGRSQPLITETKMAAFYGSLLKSSLLDLKPTPQMPLVPTKDGPNGRVREHTLNPVDMYMVAYFAEANRRGHIWMAYGDGVTSLRHLESVLRIPSYLTNQIRQFDVHDQHIGAFSTAVQAVVIWCEKVGDTGDVLMRLVHGDEEGGGNAMPVGEVGPSCNYGG